jgi:Na+/phosphate symporter
MQSVLDYAVEQFTEHRDDLEKEMITKTEEQINERQEQIKEFIMSEKELYLASIGIQED